LKAGVQRAAALCVTSLTLFLAFAYLVGVIMLLAIMILSIQALRLAIQALKKYLQS
jgi:hypothetical protein